MARTRKPKIEPDQVRGLNYLWQITTLLHRLHDDATAQDRAGNRTLLRPAAALVLVAMFSDRAP